MRRPFPPSEGDDNPPTEDTPIGNPPRERSSTTPSGGYITASGGSTTPSEGSTTPSGVIPSVIVMVSNNLPTGGNNPSSGESYHRVAADTSPHVEHTDAMVAKEIRLEDLALMIFGASLFVFI
ncbi:hypothetical protein A4A49_12525 [Nicotiana attenuata]|uniref:Uncharacterized protein n=1 Tax=Nicotiana attenuata TaxID=49451 RepID=A0A314KNK2_NICAT|nr:hypothetical protein A4A49_12525 [Nicotiana attenuata]